MSGVIGSASLLSPSQTPAYLPRPCSRKYARLAEPCGPDILGTAMIFSTIALLKRTKGATPSFTAYNTELKHPQ